MPFKALLYFVGASLLVGSIAYGQMSFSDSDLERYKKKSDNQAVEQGGRDEPSNGKSSGQDSQTIIRRGRSGVYDGDYSKTSDDKDVWCQRGEQARAEISSAESNAAAAREHYAVINAQFQTERTKTRFKEVADAKQEADEAYNAVDRARKALERLENEAHRKGVPPGWLKCNFN